MGDYFYCEINMKCARRVHFTLFTLQSNLLLERNQSNGFVSSLLFVPYSERSLFLCTHGTDIPNAFANSNAFSFIMMPSIGIFWLLFPTNQFYIALFNFS